MTKGGNKTINRLVDELIRQGWKLSRTGGGHWKAAAPGGKGIVFFPSTPSDTRSIKNAVSALRRLGATNLDTFK